MSKSRVDQDTPWKTVLELYFRDCLRFFFFQVHDAIDWSRPYEFLDKELQQIARGAATGRRYADKLVKVWQNDGEETWLLVHLEIQANQESGFAERMSTYNHRIVDRYKRPVVSMAILCDVNPNWRPTQYIREMLGCRMEFNFLTVKLLDYQLQWQQLETSRNPFATVVMTHLKAQETRKDVQDRKRWKLLLIRGLYEKGYGSEDIVNLFLFIDWLLELPQELEREVWQAVEAYEQERAMPYVSSVERIGLEKGRQEGRQEGLQEGAQLQAYRSLLQILQLRFETVPAKLQTRLQRLAIGELESAIATAMNSESLKAFEEALPKAKRKTNAQKKTEN